MSGPIPHGVYALTRTPRPTYACAFCGASGGPSWADLVHVAVLDAARRLVRCPVAAPVDPVLEVQHDLCAALRAERDGDPTTIERERAGGSS